VKAEAPCFNLNVPPGPTEIAFSQSTWNQWKLEASAVRARARKSAIAASVVATLAAGLVGLALTDGTWRYSAVLYAPLAGLIAHEVVAARTLRRAFRTTGAAMRYRIVPALATQASDAELSQLAASNGVSIGPWLLRAVDTGNEVIVSTEYVPIIITGDGGGG
jgi:hypothetical protein